jgi:hypothetical protein
MEICGDSAQESSYAWLGTPKEKNFYPKVVKVVQ